MRNSREIFIMDRDGSNVRQLTNNKFSELSSQWSKDGKKIYFLSEREGAPFVYTMNVDGSNVQKVADGKVVLEPNISPDEKYFVYSKQVSEKWGIYLYNIKTGQERLLVGGN